MKKLFAFLVAFFLAFFIGCQENFITDPATSDENATKNQSPTSVNSGVIELKDRILDPRRSPLDINPIPSFDVLGQVKYEHSLFYVGSRMYVKLYLKTFAELKDPLSPQDVLWTVEGKSQDFILMNNISDKPPTTITKTYSVQGRDDKMKLVIKFAVSTKDVRLNEVRCYFDKVQVHWLDIDKD